MRYGRRMFAASVRSLQMDGFLSRAMARVRASASLGQLSIRTSQDALTIAKLFLHNHNPSPERASFPFFP